MSFIAGAIIGGAVIGGAASMSAANSASSASNRASRRSLGEQRRQYDLTRSDYAPWRDAGAGALQNLQNPQDSFMQSPGYEWARNEGMRNVNNSFSARTSGGNAMKALTEFQTGLAQQDYGNWWNRQYNVAGMGANAVSGTATAGMNAANNNTNTIMQNGANQANAAMTRYSGVNDAVQSGLGNYMYAQGNGLIGGTKPQVVDTNYMRRPGVSYSR